jgi:hypothetical protein
MPEPTDNPALVQDALLDTLPASILLDLARNESATPGWRKAATKLLMKKGYAQAKHQDLRWFVHEIEEEEKAEMEVVAVVEAAAEQELPPDAVTFPVDDRESIVYVHPVEEGPVLLGPINPTSVVKPSGKRR